MNNIFEFHRELNIKKVISVFILAVFIIILIVVFHPQNTEKKLKEEEDGKELYHISYATREGSAAFLESLTEKKINEGLEEDAG